MNVIYFPCCWKRDGGIWHGGRFFDSVDELADALTDKVRALQVKMSLMSRPRGGI